MNNLEELSQEELNKLVLDYINAEDITGFDIDLLENNYNFMTRVIMKSNDKNFYDLCSDNLKRNLPFVKFLVFKFQDDKEYVDKILEEYFKQCTKEEKLDYKIITFFVNNMSDKEKLHTITDYFINNSNDEVLKLELMLVMSNDHDNFLEYTFRASTQILATIAEIQLELNEIKEKNLKDLIGLGFIIVKEKYQNNEIILNEFAMRFLYDIFYANNFNIEKFLHRSFSSKEAVEKYGLNTFIGDYIKQNDDSLAEYVLARPELIQDILKDFNYAYSHWNEFSQKNDLDRISIIYEEAEKYLEKNSYDISFSYFEAVYYVAKQKGLEGIFDEYNMKYYCNPRDSYEPVDLSIMTIYHDNFNFKELKYLKFLDDLFNKLFNERVVDEVSDDYIIQKNPGEIIDFSSSSFRK